MPTNKVDVIALDAAILAAVSKFPNGCTRHYVDTDGKVAALLATKIVTARLRALKRAGLVSVRGNMWRREGK